jgi:hypothetical protein
MKKLLTIVAAVALCGAVALSVTGVAGARSIGTTKITIHKESDGFFGYVKSDKPNRCANGRLVTVFRLKGDTPDPKVDKVIGSDTAQANNNGYQWNTGNSGNTSKGTYYAHAKKIKGLCRAGISKLV